MNGTGHRRSQARARVLTFLLIASMLLSVFPAGSAFAAPPNTALQFNGSNQYVTFLNPPSLGLATFTIETWFKRTGTGVGTDTSAAGGGGLQGAIPLVTKGRGESDGSNFDMNYFLGINAAGALVADFEEGPSTGGTLGLNHAVVGSTVVPLNTWHHAAATYDGQTLTVYLDGAVNGSVKLVVPRPPRSDSIQHAALGSALNSAGVAAGFFAGALDEARIWDRARTQAEVQAAMYQELLAGDGLVARWGMNEGAGTSIASSVGTVPPGTLTNGPTWVAGFPIPDTISPTAPTGLTATAGNSVVKLTWNANGEPDLAGYHVYRDNVRINTDLVAQPTTIYYDYSLTNGTSHAYVVKAVDTAQNESTASNEVSATPQAARGALQFSGTNQYVTFGVAPGLGASNFTLETWLKRTGTGAGTSTGTGGLSSAIPLVTKGRAQSDGSNLDCNYFFGIDSVSGKLAADFEDVATGANHPVTGATVVTSDVWHHAAATYYGTTWRLYLDGNLDTTLAANATPRYDSIQHAALGSALTSTGVAAGFFQGALDESRIWNRALTQSEILVNKNQETAAGSGLVARWGLDEGLGLRAADSVGSIHGALLGEPTWIAGFPPPDTTPPAAPAGLKPTAGDGQVVLAWTANAEPDLAGYNVYRATTSPVPTDGAPLNGTMPVTVAAFADSTAVNGTTYFYVVTAVDTSANASTASNEVSATPKQIPPEALSFNGTSQYATFGQASGLGSTAFTLETWVKRQAPGTPAYTGASGINAVPLITKGRHEADGSNVDMNYLLGISTDTGHADVLAADFEDAATGLNHPVYGTKPIPADDRWHHTAVTYDGATWRLYLDGDLDTTLTVNATPRSDSIQHAALATTLDSQPVEVPEGYFAGTLDEARIWNYARSQAQIQAAKDYEVPQAAGLVGRWGMNDGGSTIADSSGSGIAGALIGSPRWTAGFPKQAPPDKPAAPIGLGATSGNGLVRLAWDANAEPDLAGYLVYRNGAADPLNASPITVASFVDQPLTNGTTYSYLVRAINTRSNLSDPSVSVSATPLASLGYALDLAPTATPGPYVALGNPDKLHLSTFTLETWFRRDGAGLTTTTGTGGIANAVPLVTKGRGEGERADIDLNYFLGIDASGNVLAADFEEGASGASPSLNHPVLGKTIITNGVWHHAAATYDGTTWHLYLDGSLEATLIVGQPVAAAGNQHAAIGSALTSTGAAAGFFDGVIDEARIWNRALSADEITQNTNAQVISGNGLVARWGLEEGSGTVVVDSVANPANGTITGSGFAWAAGAPFNAKPNLAPDQPSVVSPSSGTSVTGTSTQLRVSASDPDGGNLTVTFYGRPKAGTPTGSNFTLAVLPDTQYYTAAMNGGSPSIFSAQTQWIVDHQADQQIAFVTHLGDITDSGNNDADDSEWTAADTAMSKLERVTADPSDDVPFSLVVGNHDVAGTGTSFENHFGVARFDGRPYYGGHYGTDNLTSYSVFSAGGMSFVVLNLPCTTTAPSADALAWADGVLKNNAGRRGIVVCHTLFTSTSALSTIGTTVLDALKGNPNLFLMLGGHVAGEGRLTSTGTDGHAIYLVLADYQSYANGGNGYLRLLEFQPAASQIEVRTYSPTLNQSETDPSSQFTLPFAATTDFQPIGNATVASGATASVTWSGLGRSAEYEWYAVVDDGRLTTTGSTWTFTTEGNHAPVAVDTTGTVGHKDGTAVEFELTANDLDNDLLTFKLEGTNGGATHGSVTVVGNKATYVANGDNAESDSFQFRANDGTTDSYAATVSIALTNTPPSATVSLTPSAPTVGDQIVATAAGSDADGDAITFSYKWTRGDALVPGQTAATYTGERAGGDTLAVEATPNDGLASGTPATASVTLVNSTPVANNQTVTVGHRSTTGVAITLMATDADGDPLTYSLVDATGEPVAGTLATTHGSVSLSGNIATYQPTGDIVDADGFGFVAEDAHATSETSTVTVTLTNALPTVAVSLSPTNPKSTDTITATATSSDIDGDEVTLIYAWTRNVETQGDQAGATYTGPRARGDIIGVTVTPNDGHTMGTAATSSVTVVNAAPEASSDSASVSHRSTAGVVIPLYATDPDGSSLSYSLVGQNGGAQRGKVTLSGGKATYIPNAKGDYVGFDRFSWRVSDGSLFSDNATITVELTNAQPTASVSLTPGNPTISDTIRAQASGSDPDGDSVTLAYVWYFVRGDTLIPIPGQTSATYSGARAKDDVIRVEVTPRDGHEYGTSGSTEITIANSIPVATNGTASISRQKGVTPVPPITITIALRATDADSGDTLTYTQVSGPSQGTISIEPSTGIATYTWTKTSVATDSFRFKVNDGTTDSNEATVNISLPKR